MIGTITRIRVRIIDEAMQLLKDCIMHLRNAKPGSWNCLIPNSREDVCDAMTLGSLIKLLSEEQLQLIWDGTSSMMYLKSFNHLKIVLQGISMVRIYDCHKGCNPIPAIIEKLQIMAERLESPVTEEHISHLSRQREKTSL